MTTNEAGTPGRGAGAAEFRARVREFIFKTFYVADHQALRDDTSLLEAGLVDSTGVLEIIQFIEATFGVHVEDDEIVPENLDSVERLAAYVSRKTAPAGG